MRGFGVAEFLIVLTVFVVLIGLVLVLIPKAQIGSSDSECMNNVRNLTGLLTIGGDYPEKGGANRILDLIPKGEIEGDYVNVLRCPGDRSGNQVSYAARDMGDPACRSAQKPFALICDDSMDHHERGLVVGYTDGSVKFKEYPKDTVVGRESKVAELRCLRKD